MKLVTDSEKQARPFTTAARGPHNASSSLRGCAGMRYIFQRKRTPSIYTNELLCSITTLTCMTRRKAISQKREADLRCVCAFIFKHRGHYMHVSNKSWHRRWLSFVSTFCASGPFFWYEPRRWGCSKWDMKTIKEKELSAICFFSSSSETNPDLFFKSCFQ